MRIRDIAHQRPRFGYQRIHVMLRREGWLVNKKRVRRLYRLEGLQLRMRIRRRKHMCLHRGVVPQAQRTHERWSMDFVYDALADCKAFRVLTVVDQWSRWSPILEVLKACQDARLQRRSIARSSSTEAPLDHRRSWHRVHVASARRVGVPTRRVARLHPTRNACRVWLVPIYVLKVSDLRGFPASASIVQHIIF